MDLLNWFGKSHILMEDQKIVQNLLTVYNVRMDLFYLHLGLTLLVTLSLYRMVQPHLVCTLSPGKTLPGVAGSVTTVCSTTRPSSTRQTNMRLSTYSLSCFRKHWLVG